MDVLLDSSDSGSNCDVVGEYSASFYLYTSLVSFPLSTVQSKGKGKAHNNLHDDSCYGRSNSGSTLEVVGEYFIYLYIPIITFPVNSARAQHTMTCIRSAVSIPLPLICIH